MRAVLLSTYELGRQPFGLASPSAWLRARGHDVAPVDLAVSPFPTAAVREADVVGIYLPMHTAARLAAVTVRRVREVNASVPIVCFGLYAPLSETHLRDLGVSVFLGGEFEAALADYVDSLSGVPDDTAPRSSEVLLDRLRFLPPDRTALAPLSAYPKLVRGPEHREAGYTEASRGCKHRCRHCPIVPVYNGTFRIVQADVVMSDIRNQVAAGARHITFGDPDFFNGPLHARRVIEQLHREFPDVSYDVTIKVEHLLQHREMLPLLRETGCAFVTTAVESLDDLVLQRLEKGHTREDFLCAADLARRHGLTLAPTFIPFTPWTTAQSYATLLQTIQELDLVENVAPVQLSLRLLIPHASRLLELAEIQSAIAGFDPQALVWRWKHPDPSVDALSSRVLGVVNEAVRTGATRPESFRQLWELVHGQPAPFRPDLLPRTIIPYMEEPWFC